MLFLSLVHFATLSLYYVVIGHFATLSLVISKIFGEGQRMGGLT
jgi:hypothetical protein